jgi:hypothetical protein
MINTDKSKKGKDREKTKSKVREILWRKEPFGKDLPKGKKKFQVRFPCISRSCPLVR